MAALQHARCWPARSPSACLRHVHRKIQFRIHELGIDHITHGLSLCPWCRFCLHLQTAKFCGMFNGVLQYSISWIMMTADVSLHSWWESQLHHVRPPIKTQNIQTTTRPELLILGRKHTQSWKHVISWFSPRAGHQTETFKMWNYTFQYYV